MFNICKYKQLVSQTLALLDKYYLVSIIAMLLLNLATTKLGTFSKAGHASRVFTIPSGGLIQGVCSYYKHGWGFYSNLGL